MKCSEVQHSVPEYLEDMLPEDQRGKIREHLTECSVCEKHASRIGSISGDLKRLAQGPIPFDLENAILKRMAEGLPDERSGGSGKVWGAVIAAGLLLGVYFLGTRFIRIQPAINLAEKIHEPSPKEIQEAMIMNNLELLQSKLSSTSRSPRHRAVVAHLEPFNWRLKFLNVRERQMFSRRIKELSGSMSYESECLLVFSMDQTNLQRLDEMIKKAPGASAEGPNIDFDTLPTSQSPLRIFIFMEANGDRAAPLWRELRFLRRDGYVFIERLHGGRFNFIYESPEMIVLKLTFADYRRLQEEMQKMPGLQAVKGNEPLLENETLKHAREFTAVLFLT